MKTTRIIVTLAALSAIAADWPQWRGPNRDDVSKETGLLKTWPKEGPKLLWTFKNAGVGYSGPAIVGDTLYCAGGRGDTEFLFALDAKTGTEKWSAKIGPLFDWAIGNEWNAGPGATPAVDGNRVYALGGQGELVAVDSANGTIVWRKNMVKDFGGEVDPIGGSANPKIAWGYTWSPLVDGDKVVCVPGGKDGTLAALDKKTGNVIWRSTGLTELATYSSPIVAEVGGIRQYIQMTLLGVAGVAAKDGKLLWYHRREEKYTDVVIPTPIFHDSYVYTAHWTEGCDLIQLVPSGGEIKVNLVYSSPEMKNRDGGVVLVNGHVFGCSEGRAGWLCQDFKTGKPAWSLKRPPAIERGSLIYADGNLYLLGEKGNVVLLEATTDKAAGWQEKGRFELPERSKLNKVKGMAWTHPVIANGRLFLRDQELLFCFDVKAK